MPGIGRAPRTKAGTGGERHKATWLLFEIVLTLSLELLGAILSPSTGTKRVLLKAFANRGLGYI